jgi:hypothetical protein
LVDFDALFEQATTPPVILNTFNVDTVDDKTLLDSMVYTYYDGDSLNVVPMCECQRTTGAGMINQRCSFCGTTVLPLSERPLESLLWMEPPAGVETFINPQVWTMLSKAMTHGGINGLLWLVDPLAIVGPEPHKEIRRLMDLGIDRGINHFYKNFDQIIELLFNTQVIAGGNRHQREELWQFIQCNRHKIFAKRLPVPSRMGFVAERTVTGTFADKTMKPMLDAIRTISSAVHSQTPLDIRKLQSRTMLANDLVATYSQDFMAATLTSKRGWLRKHVYGNPLFFTFRGVISSMSERHEYDELHVPWGICMSTYSKHLENKLYKTAINERGRPFTPNEAIGLIESHTLRYHPVLHSLFNELIEESPHKGLPVLFNRNPSLDRGSIQEFFITKVIEDPEINAIAMSVLCLKAPNADFDGDALNGMAILDNRSERHFAALAPHFGALDLDHPRRMSNNQAFPPPVAGAIANMVHRSDRTVVQ